MVTKKRIEATDFRAHGNEVLLDPSDSDNRAANDIMTAVKSVLLRRISYKMLRESMRSGPGTETGMYHSRKQMTIYKFDGGMKNYTVVSLFDATVTACVTAATPFEIAAKILP